MANILYWGINSEIQELHSEGYLKSKLVERIADFPETEIENVFFFTIVEKLQTPVIKNFDLKIPKLKAYWESKYNSDLSDLCGQYGLDFSDTYSLKKESNYFFKSEYKNLNAKYSTMNRKGEVKISEVKIPVTFNEDDYHIYVHETVFKNNPGDKYILFYDELDLTLKNKIAEAVFPFNFRRFPIRTEEENKRREVVSRQKIGEVDYHDADYYLFDKKEDVSGPKYFTDILSEDSKIIELKHYCESIAKTEFPVLILGDSGTGKELFARAIHSSSPRSSKNYFTINCGAIPDNLLESELFGHEKGAFTDAKYLKIGLFQKANGGTIFLDEIGDLSLVLQVKILRAIENGVIRRVGGIEDIPINVRFVFATNKNLYNEVKENRFREDLYHRINVIDIKLPSLKERSRNDIDLILTKGVLEKYPELYKQKFKRSAKELLFDYDWPGNIRELKNVIQKAILLSKFLKTDIDRDIIERCIGKDAIEDYYDRKKLDKQPFSTIPVKQKWSFFKRTGLGDNEIEINNTLLLKGFNLGKLLDSIEKAYISEALKIEKKQTEAGKLLGYSQQKMSLRAKKYKL